MKISFVFVMMCFCLISNAQPKINYTASLEAGLAKGSNDNSTVCFFGNGIAYKNIIAGLGVGIDNYVIRSVPLYLDVKKQFGRRKIKPFVGASAGINFQHPTDEQKIIHGSWYQTDHFKNGFFTKASAGISMPVYHKLRLFINAGYTYKTTSVKHGNVFLPSDGPTGITTDIYHFNRWFASIGVCL